jgi:hypothetical protein
MVAAVGEPESLQAQQCDCDDLVALRLVVQKLANDHYGKHAVVANMATIAICSSMILVIHTQHNHGTNQND